MSEKLSTMLDRLIDASYHHGAAHSDAEARSHVECRNATRKMIEDAFASAEGKSRALLLELEEQAQELYPTLTLDILGMAFYRNTGVWPPFKSAPPYTRNVASDEEAMRLFREWRGTSAKETFTR